MANGAFIGVGGVAKKIKNMYIGVGGVAKKVKKAYIGVNGVAKLFWSGDITSSVTFTGALSSTVTGTTYTGYGNSFGAVFKGSENASTNTYYINTSLTRTILSGGSTIGVAAANPKYLLVTGGAPNSSASSANASIDAIDSSGTITKSVANLTARRYQHATGNFANYAFVAGGYTGASKTDVVDTIDTSLTVSTLTALSVSRRRLQCSKNSSYILFAGGYGNSTSSTYSTVDAYNSSLTRSTATVLSAETYDHAGGWNDNYALFAGGNLGTVVNAYNTSLTRSTSATLTLTSDRARSFLMGSGSSGMAIFSGGSYIKSAYNGYYYNNTDCYNIDLTKTTTYPYSGGLREAGIANINDKYFVIVGGINNDYNDEDSEGYEYSTKIYAFTLA